ncbi:MAG: site-specific DNA-methyltransferase, partial [Nanoarchaeota archaeon]|nr:site-specific DNA-methyltransferase [Nanoarchaeota archaeon]
MIKLIAKINLDKKTAFGVDDTHPTEKPVKLFRMFIEMFTQEGELVLDNCIGSGTTAVACKQANRRFIGIELN